VVGALWFLVLLPSFIRGDHGKEYEEKPSVRETVATKLGEQATKALRAKRARNITAGLAGVSALIASLAFVEFATRGSALVMAVVASVSTLGLAVLAIRNNKSYRNLISGSVKRDLPITLTNNKAVTESGSVDSKTFHPGAVPNQNFLRTGAIEIVELAEVHSIEDSKPKTEIDNLDEILRRRRHVG
jgi:hypothetical protein